MTEIAESPVALRRYTKVTAASTLFLVFAGAMVTSTGSGLAVPDWPLAFGMVFPPMVGGVFYEHGHRLIAATVGLLTLIQAFWLQAREPKPFLRRLGWVSLAVVIVQGTLGGLTVIFLLPPLISVSHAALAEIFLALNVSIAFFASRSYVRISGRRTADAKLAGIAKLLVAAFFVQILIGALMRHLGAGLAIPDFPLAYGRLVPEFVSLGVAVNFAHRTWGLVLGITVALLAPLFIGRSDAAVRRVYGALLVLVFVQITLGAYVVWSGRQEIITSLHVMTGALTVATTVLLALTASAVEKRSRREQPVAQELLA
jgi:heme a synthase